MNFIVIRLFTRQVFHLQCLLGQQQLYGSYNKGSIHSSFSLGIFWKLDHQFFLNFGMLLETQLKWSMTEPDFFRKSFFPQTQEKWVKVRPKTNFFKINKKLVFNFPWICFIIKNNLICCVSVHNLYLVEILFTVMF